MNSLHMDTAEKHWGKSQIGIRCKMGHPNVKWLIGKGMILPGGRVAWGGFATNGATPSSLI